jgi:hypothetical protein
MTTGPALCRGLLPEANAVALDVGANIGVTAAVLRTVKFFEHFAYGYITTNPNAPTIPAITVDGFVEEHSLARVDFIKIDVEGFEKAVLEGATRTIARHSPIDLPPLNVATFRERISGGANQGRARDATREEVHCGADHREAPRG